LSTTVSSSDKKSLAVQSTEMQKIGLLNARIDKIE